MRIVISNKVNITTILNKVRAHLTPLGLDDADEMAIITTCSELSQNILKFAPGGCLCVKYKDDMVWIQADDTGPGIVDLENAVKEGVSLSNSLGIGLPAIIRWSDELEIETSAGGTKITCGKRMA